MKLRLGKAASLALVALCILSTAAGALRDSVLCRGADGHLAIERALAGECGPLDDGGDLLTQSLAAPAPEGCCGPCRDVTWPENSFVGSPAPASSSPHGPKWPAFASLPNPATTSVVVGVSARWTNATPAVRFVHRQSPTVLRC